MDRGKMVDQRSGPGENLTHFLLLLCSQTRESEALTMKVVPCGVVQSAAMRSMSDGMEPRTSVLSTSILALLLAAGSMCFGQSAAQPLTPGTIVTGQCQGHERSEE